MNDAQEERLWNMHERELVRRYGDRVANLGWCMDEVAGVLSSKVYASPGKDQVIFTTEFDPDTGKIRKHISG